VPLHDSAFSCDAAAGTVELQREAFIKLAEASPYDDICIMRDGQAVLRKKSARERSRGKTGLSKGRRH
jgi:hypothetical protein